MGMGRGQCAIYNNKKGSTITAGLVIIVLITLSLRVIYNAFTHVNHHYDLHGNVRLIIIICFYINLVKL